MPFASKDDYNAWCRRRYRENIDAQRERSRKKAAANRKRCRDFLGEYLATHPCIDCGESDPVVLEFDHRDPKEKKFALVMVAKGKVSFGSVVKEVAKCDVRCANCHRRRTHRQRQDGILKPGHSPRISPAIAPG